LVTPVAITDRGIKCVGKVPTKEEIKSWINQQGVFELIPPVVLSASLFRLFYSCILF